MGNRARPPATDAPDGIERESQQEYFGTEPARRLAPPKRGGLYYLAGPMSGYPDYNFPAFNEAAAVLRGEHGLRILNPAETAGGDPSMEKTRYMRIDFGYLLVSDGIILMPGWWNSDGAKRELLVTDALGLPAWYYDYIGRGYFERVTFEGFSLRYKLGSDPKVANYSFAP